MFRQWICALLLTTSVSVVNATENVQKSDGFDKARIIQAIGQLAESPREKWSVLISDYENEEGDETTKLQRFTPNEELEKRWTLLSINGKKPDASQLEEYFEKKREQVAKSGQKRSYRVDFNTLIQKASLHLVEESDSHILAGFDVVMEELGHDAKGKLQGSLNFNKAKDFIEQIKIQNSEKFSPIFSASITDLSLIFNFIERREAVLPKRIEMQMKGSFAYFTEIDEVSTTDFSEYKYMEGNVSN